MTSLKDAWGSADDWIPKPVPEKAQPVQAQNRRSGRNIPNLTCEDCGNTWWDIFRDGGSHKCTQCGFWIPAYDPRLSYGRSRGI
jgi:hypothetical protein